MTLNGNPGRLVDLKGSIIEPVLDKLLRDMTTGRNIMFRTDNYKDKGFGPDDEITPEALDQVDIVPRCEKTAAVQSSRAKARAEIFTPAWMVNRMCNMMDEMGFGKPNVFTYENDDHTWRSNDSHPDYGDWMFYVNATGIEITCGEGPFLTMRQDAATGARIDYQNRAGMLDRKLKVVRECVEQPEEKLEWALRALRACYGFEWQGDSLLLARANMLLTFCDFCCRELGTDFVPDEQLLAEAADIICWNLWQMDGLTGKIPGTDQACLIMNWREGQVETFPEPPQDSYGKKRSRARRKRPEQDARPERACV